MKRDYFLFTLVTVFFCISGATTYPVTDMLISFSRDWQEKTADVEKNFESARMEVWQIQDMKERAVMEERIFDWALNLPIDYMDEQAWRHIRLKHRMIAGVRSLPPLSTNEAPVLKYASYLGKLQIAKKTQWKEKVAYEGEIMETLGNLEKILASFSRSFPRGVVERLWMQVCEKADLLPDKRRRLKRFLQYAEPVHTDPSDENGAVAFSVALGNCRSLDLAWKKNRGQIYEIESRAYQLFRREHDTVVRSSLLSRLFVAFLKLPIDWQDENAGKDYTEKNEILVRMFSIPTLVTNETALLTYTHSQMGDLRKRRQRLKKLIHDNNSTVEGERLKRKLTEVQNCVKVTINSLDKFVRKIVLYRTKKELEQFIDQLIFVSELSADEAAMVRRRLLSVLVEERNRGNLGRGTPAPIN
ncbi:MAG: hypothetical protein IJR99_16190 [Kiritimatiellae bacterium]|nr:hypothetical protein [Kiritimatiellia bacterium]